MAEEYNKSHVNEHENDSGAAAAEAETTDRGLFDFLGKKKEEKPAAADHHHQEEEEVMVSEFDKVKVSDDYEAPHPNKQHESSYNKVEEEEDKKPPHESLLQKLQRSDSSSSSSSDEEHDDEEKKKKRKEKKEKKGLAEKIKGKISGEEDTAVPVEKYYGEEKHDESKIVHHPALDEPSPVASEEKKGFLEKIKEKLPGGHKKAEEHEEVPAAHGYSTEAAVEAAASHEGEPKKGILEKIKEKLPGYHPKADQEEKEIIKEKEKDASSY